MKESPKQNQSRRIGDIPLIIEEDIINDIINESVNETVNESEKRLRKASEDTSYTIRKSIEDLQESKRLHDLIDEYDFDNLDDDEA